MPAALADANLIPRSESSIVAMHVNYEDTGDLQVAPFSVVLTL